MKILILEDEAFSAMVTIAFFQDEGHEVKHASDSDEAIEFLSTFTPDVLVSDWTVEGSLSAAEVAAKARARNPQLRIAFVTGHSQQDLAHELADLAPFRFYTKPVDLEKLVVEVFQPDSTAKSR